jgi:hypothetical protein
MLNSPHEQNLGYVDLTIAEYTELPGLETKPQTYTREMFSSNLSRDIKFHG